MLDEVLLTAVQVVQRRGESAVGGWDEGNVTECGCGLVVVAGFRGPIRGPG